MKIAAILNAHGNTELTNDTLESIRYWVTDNVVVLIDGNSWGSWGKDAPLQAHKLQGLIHNCTKSPYRNLTLSLMEASKTWPDVDWYCYVEYDVLFGSNSFKNDLEYANKNNIWCVGNDMRGDDYHKHNCNGVSPLHYLEHIIGEKINCTKYLLGCCVFYRSDFIHLLQEKGFFDRFLLFTNHFHQGYFPGYTEERGYDFGEHLYPTLAYHYGGQVGGWASWERDTNEWKGNYRKYPLRWTPELDPVKDNFPESAIMHPLKSLDNPLRVDRRLKRKSQI